jgi:hypothetical protein
MTTNLAYQVSYATEYRDGHIETHDEQTRFFATREQAVAHAKHLTGDREPIGREYNGVFVSEWVTPYAAILAPEDAEEIRVTAIIETVTLDEIEESL